MRTLALSILVFLLPVAAAAEDWVPPIPADDTLDWLQLSSGEWVRGTIELLQNEKLSFDSEEMDDLEFDWEDVVEIRTNRTLTVGLYDGSILTGPVLMKDGVLAIRTITGVQQANAWQVRSIIEGTPSELNYWSFRATANLVARSGNTEQNDFNSFVRVRRQTTMSRFNLEYNGNYGSTDGMETVSNSRLKGDVNLFLTRKLFVTPASADFFKDRFQNIELRSGLGAGFGYYIIRSATDWQINAGGGWQRTTYQSVSEGEDRSVNNGTITLGTVLETDITSDIELDAEYSVRRTLGTDKRTLHHVYAMLSFDLIGDIIDFNASVTWDYNSNPKENADGVVPKKSDLTMAYGLGIDF
jgi:putative salt-induced outer membrane protein YdiY